MALERTGERAVYDFLSDYAFSINEDDFIIAINSARESIKGNGSYKKGLFFKALLSGLNCDIDWCLAEEIEDMFVQRLE